MRWELTFIIPGGGNTATNRDLPRRLLMMSVQRSRVWVRPFRLPCWFICTCLGVFNCGGTFRKSPPLAFSLTCGRTESWDRWRASINTIWNYPNWWYLAVINLIKALHILWYDHPVYQGRPQLLAVPVTHYLPATCPNMHNSIWISLILGWTLE